MTQQDAEAILFGALMRATNDIVVVHDGEKVLFASEEANRRFAERADATLVGRSIWDFVPADRMEEVRQRWETVKLGEAPPHVEIGLLHASGEEITVSVQSLPAVIDARPAAVVVARDITESRERARGAAESEERFRRLYESVQAGVLVQQADGTLTHANRIACEAFGLDRSELIHSTSQDPKWNMVTEEGQPMAGEDHPSMVTLRTGKPVRNAVRGVFADDPDRMRWLLINTEPVFETSHDLPSAVIVTFQDITELKQANERVQLQATVLDQIQDVVTVTDLGGRITYVNRAVSRLLDMPQEELVGKSVEIYGDDPSQGATQREIVELTVQQGWWRGEVVNYAPDGREVIIDCRTQLFTDAAGKPVGMSGIGTDITERKRRERALTESEARYRAIMEQSHDPIMLLSDVIVDCNAATLELLGHPRDKVIGRSPLELSPPAQPDGRTSAEVLADLLAAARSGESATATWQCLDGAGQIIDVEVSLGPILVEGEQYVLAIGRDVRERLRAERERREMEARIQHTQKLESLGVLAGGIAHDFNNILTSILGNADLALHELPRTAPAREHVMDIEVASRRAADLCRQMLAYSGRGKFVIEILRFEQIIEEISRMLEVSISKRAVLKYKFADNVPPVRGDITQIRQIVMNLITNASEAIGDRSGVISISTGAMHCDVDYMRSTYMEEDLPEGVYSFIEVADTGCGMDAATRQRMFEPFFTTKFTGRGLGMAAVLGIVRGHHGAIKVYSEKGRGTTIKVLLPACAGEPEGSTGSSPTKSTWRGEGAVMLVDDEETVRVVGKKLLETMGLKVHTARDGCEAVALFREHHPHIKAVVLDLTMPHMDGEQTFTELRRIDPNVRVLLSSGYNEQDVTQRFVGKGLAGFIQKPYQLETLAEMLRRVMDGDKGRPGRHDAAPSGP